MKKLLSLNEVNTNHGGKALGLRELIELKLLVPEAIVFDISALQELFNANQCILNELDKWCSKNNGQYAVRSSAIGEDGKHQSFAGMYHSELLVTKKDLVNSIKNVALSGQSTRVKSYGNHTTELIPVIVQKMVDAQYSGVTFTVVNQYNNIPVSYTEWIGGLGEALVSGKVTPHSIQIPLQEDGPVTTSGEKLPSNLQQKLKDLILLLKNTNHGEWDIEWSIDKNNQLYTLQLRPITSAVNIASGTEKGEPIGASPGVAMGNAKFVNDDNHESLRSGEILVSEITEVDYLPAMKRSGAIITEEGGLLSHAAIIAREIGIPCVVGVKNALTLLTESKDVMVNGNLGIIKQDKLTLGHEKKHTNDELDFKSLYLYDRGFHVDINETSLYLEPTFNGLLAHSEHKIPYKKLIEINKSLLESTGIIPEYVVSDKGVWAKEWNRFNKLRSVNFVETNLRRGIQLWNPSIIKSAIINFKEIALLIPQISENNDIDTLYKGELGAALHAMVFVTVEGFCVWKAYVDTKDWRLKNHIAFNQFITNLYPKSESTTKFKSIHECISVLENLRNESYKFFSGHNIFNADYFNKRNELIFNASKDFDSQQLTLDQIYLSDRFIQLDELFLKKILNILSI